MTCPTRSGPYRCEREAGHAGECECEAAPYRARARVTAIIGTVPGVVSLTEAEARAQGYPSFPAPVLIVKTSEGAAPLAGHPVLSTPGGGSEEPGTTTLEKRVRVLEEQVASLQMAAPRGIPSP